MKERNFLTEIKIVGAMLASYEGELLHYSIPNLLKWCDWVLIMLDNYSRKTRKIAWEYKKKYPARVRLSYTNLPKSTKKQFRLSPSEKIQKGGILRRYKQKASLMRESVFNYTRQCLENGEKIDILLFPDADEIFGDTFPSVLENFWEQKERKAITFKPSSVFGDMKTIKGRSMSPHVRVLRYSPEFTAVPYRNFANYFTLAERKDKLGCRYVMVHLFDLLPETRKWRKAHWKRPTKLEEPLWKLDKDVRKIRPEEIRSILKQKPHTTVGEYLKNI